MKKLLNLRKLKEGGFTLIEMLLYMAIFSLVIGAIVGLTIVTSGELVKNETTADVNLQGESCVQQIVIALKSSIRINSPQQGQTANSLLLSSFDSTRNPTLFQVVNDGTTDRLQIVLAGGRMILNLTNAHVKVSNLTFTNMGVAGTRGAVTFSFTLTYNTASNRQEFNYAKTFYGGASIP